MDLGLSLVCALIQTSVRVGGRALNWKAECLTLDLVNCSVVEQYAYSVSSIAGGQKKLIAGGKTMQSVDNAL